MLSDFQWQVKMMFPRVTSKLGGMRGDGQFAIINKCGRRWSIWMYPTADEAKAKLKQWADNPSGCEIDALTGGDRCARAHEKLLVKVDEAWINSKLEAQMNKEPKPRKRNKGEDYPTR
jgi:hypothetical protein